MKLLNFGSLNLDYMYRVPHIVAEGETLTSHSLDVRAGGKGLNQSVTLCKAGGEVYHAGCIGADGEELRELCTSLGIHTDFLETVSVRTGNALIQVDDGGRNSIVLFPGANREITKEMVESVLTHFGPGDILVLQNEVNDIAYILKRAADTGMKVVLNPSPYDEAVERCDLTQVSLLILNEVEGEQITGACKPEDMMDRLLSRFPHLEVVLTLGAQGAWFAGGGQREFAPACQVEAVDTTGAGDTFTGYFVEYYLDRRMNVREALGIATLAAGLSVTKAGAAPSIPSREEVERARRHTAP